MFYCEKCQEENDWPKSWVKSHGKCECCDKVGSCYDLHHRYLTPQALSDPRMYENKNEAQIIREAKRGFAGAHS